jgi:hypothetical protein
MQGEKQANKYKHIAPHKSAFCLTINFSPNLMHSNLKIVSIIGDENNLKHKINTIICIVLKF